MDDDHAACNEIVEQAFRLSKTICSSANSVEAAEKFLQLAMQALATATKMGVMELEFQARVERLRRARDSQADYHASQILEAQLDKFGIDHKPIFEARSNSDGPRQLDSGTSDQPHG